MGYKLEKLYCCSRYYKPTTDVCCHAVIIA